MLPAAIYFVTISCNAPSWVEGAREMAAPGSEAAGSEFFRSAVGNIFSFHRYCSERTLHPWEEPPAIAKPPHMQHASVSFSSTAALECEHASEHMSVVGVGSGAQRIVVALTSDGKGGTAVRAYEPSGGSWSAPRVFGACLLYTSPSPRDS